ncbi:MAG: L,D-transpeptidase family protein [Deltaproteobacteria bacterium]|nr:L,D-transpeptidase family protein [Deltaproteobacteria bacterium]
MPTVAFAIPQANLVMVKKSEAKLYLMKGGKVFREYHVVLGGHPKGPKQRQGDERTPEGRYILDYKNARSSFYKSIHISYPNKADRERARKAHVKPGGDIMIHGQKNGWRWLSFLSRHFNWTDGCIAVTNSEMDEIWDAVKIGTPIEILP